MVQHRSRLIEQHDIKVEHLILHQHGLPSLGVDGGVLDLPAEFQVGQGYHVGGQEIALVTGAGSSEDESGEQGRCCEGYMSYVCFHVVIQNRGH